MLSGDLRTLFPYVFFRPVDVRSRYVRRWVRVHLADRDAEREQALKKANGMYVRMYVCMLYASPLPYIQCPELSYYLLITHYYRYKESGFHCRGGGILYECIYCMYVFANYMLLLLLHCEVRPSKSSLVTIPPHLFTVCFEAVAVDHSPSTAPENRPGYPPPYP